MAIFKIITSPDGSSIGRATPEKLEDYLKYEENEQGERISRTDKISAINATEDCFSEDCEAVSERFNKCNTYDEIKYRHYVQGFPPEDCSKMTRERCHQLGVEMAKAFWENFPVLVVTHFEQQVEGSKNYHWHNHFLVYNCNINNGHKIDRSGSSLWEQKKYVAAQAEAEGLTRKGLILENGRIRESQAEVKAGMQERKIRKRGQSLQNKRDSQEMFFTQKAELRIAIISAIDQTSNYEDFCNFLKDAYGIETKESRGALSFLHPERKNSGRAWIRGASLGEYFTKENIINELEQRNDRWSNIQSENRENRNEYLERLYKQVFGYIPTDTTTESSTGLDRSPGTTLTEKSRDFGTDTKGIETDTRKAESSITEDRTTTKQKSENDLRRSSAKL